MSKGSKLYLSGMVASVVMLVVPAVASAGLLSSAGTQNGSGSSSVVGLLPDVIEVGKSEAAHECDAGDCPATGAHYTYASLLGEELLGVEPDGDPTDGDGNWTGALAGLGPVIDGIEGGALECQASGPLTICPVLLSSDSYVDPEFGAADAQGGTGVQILDAEGNDVTIALLRSHARAHSSGEHQCSDAFLATVGSNDEETIAIDPSTSYDGVEC